MTIEVDPDDMIGSEIVRQGCWEWETFTFLEQWLARGMTVIDAGANIGQYAMLASARVGPHGRVHCFEPHPGVYQVLVRNLEHAMCANVLAQPLALAGAPGERDLFLHPSGNVGATSFKPREGARKFGHSVEDLEARLRALGFRLFAITMQGLQPYTPVGEQAVNVAAVRRIDTLLRGLPAPVAAHLLLRLACVAHVGSRRRSSGTLNAQGR